VNKVATKVDLRLDLEGASAYLGPEGVARIREKLASRLDGEGRLHVVSSESRLQARNLEAALARMEKLIQSALARPRPLKPTRPTRGSRERRLAEKRQQSDKKRLRGRESGED
jgi:ribosome-associated protein